MTSKRHSLFTAILWLCSSLLFGLCMSCASGPDRAVFPADRFKAEKLIPRKAQRPEYQLGFGDVIEVKFFRNHEFNEKVLVRPDGRISLAKVGDIYVLDMTPSELDSIITKTYNEFVIEPDVTVFVRQISGHKLYVLGEVAKPGGYPVERDMNVLQAIALAGGPKDSAKLNNVFILRRTPTREMEALRIDLKQALRAKYSSRKDDSNLMMQPQDVIFVPKTNIATATAFLKQIYDGFLPPIDLYLRAVFFYDQK